MHILLAYLETWNCATRGWEWDAYLVLFCFGGKGNAYAVLVLYWF
jgi:hypothetical protein